MSTAQTLDEIRPADATRVGGKAFNCARLKQAGIAVPDGIVLTTAAMGGPVDVPELQRWLARLAPETRLAVRSSGIDEDGAGDSFAGMHATSLNVPPDGVADAVRECWASVTAPPALAYRRARHLSTDNPRTAVLVQRMVDAVASGVAFTASPIDGTTDELLVNSVFGLGEALVSGRVEPDEFRLSRSGDVLSAYVANGSPSLTPAQLRELAGLLVTIERHCGAPQDVEWCHDGAQFWIVQARPITTGAGPSREREWTRANVREVLPDLPSHMAATTWCAALNRAHENFYGRVLAPESVLGPMATLFHGRMYFNLGQVRHLCHLSGMAPATVFRSFGHQDDIAPEDEVIGRPAIGEILRVAPALARMVTRGLTVHRWARTLTTRAQRTVTELEADDVASRSPLEIWTAVARVQTRLADDIEVVLLLAASLATCDAVLRSIGARVGLPYERWALPVLAAGENSVSAQQSFDLLRLARIARSEGGRHGSGFARHFAAFMQRYGHRGRYESDFALPRYQEDPSPLLFAIDAHVAALECPDPDLLIRRRDEQAAAAWSEFQRRLTRGQRVTLLPATRGLLRRAKRLYLERELCRSELMRVVAPIRARHLHLADHFVARGWLDTRDDYFSLTFDEAGETLRAPAQGEKLRAIVAQRQAERARWARLDMPLLLRESQLPALARRLGVPRSVTDAETLRGLCVSVGSAEGEVVIMRDPGEFARMKRGAILVAPATDPAWTPLFTLAAGVIVEVGGRLSHASTVAREFGLPALANVQGATTILKDGERVLLDATNGVVVRRRTR